MRASDGTALFTVTNSLTGVNNEYTDTGNTAIDSGDIPLMAEYLYNNSGGTIVDTLSGLTAGDAFTLVIYASGDGKGQGSTISVTSGSGLTAQDFGMAATSGMDRLISGGVGDAYQEFTGTLSAANTALTITLADPANHDNISLINGIQILESVPTIPEPSTYALLGLGLLLVGKTVRSRRSVKA